MKTTYQKIVVLFAYLLLSANAYTQKIVERTEPCSVSKTELNFQFADTITVQSWNKNEVYVKVSVNINDNSNNDSFVLHSSESAGTLVFKSEINDIKNLSRKVVNENGTVNCGVQMSLIYQVWCPENIDLEIETISGNIILAGKLNNVQVKSISGFIDFGSAASNVAVIEMETISGVIYSDYEFDDQSYKNQPVGMKIKDMLKAEGNTIKLKTISGDIFYRK